MTVSPNPPESSALTTGQIQEAIIAAVSRVLEVAPESLSRSTSLADDVGADSLAIVEIVEIIEETLTPLAPGFRIEDEELDRIHTIGDAVDYISAHIGSGHIGSGRT